MFVIKITGEFCFRSGPKLLRQPHMDGKLGIKTVLWESFCEYYLKKFEDQKPIFLEKLCLGALIH